MPSDTVFIALIAGITLVSITFLVTRAIESLEDQPRSEDPRIGKLLEYSETELKALNFIVDFIKQSQQPRPPT